MPRPRALRRAVVACAAVLLTAGVAPPPPAHAADGFVFNGSGYGHGIGMSQWGAYGLATMGWDDRRILEHFYRGARVTTPDLPRNLRVGVAADERRIDARAIGGTVAVWEGEPDAGTLVGRIGSGDTWRIEPASTGFAVSDETGARVGTTWGSPSTPLVLDYETDTARVHLEQAGDPGPGTYGRGTVEVDVYGCAEGCALRAVVRLGLEQYLYGLGEVPSSWPMAALRAQATAARSYVATLIRRGLRGACGCHTSDGTSDQVYVGWSKESGPDGDRWVAAVDTTAGEAVTYGGEVVQAFYAASDGGHSEDVEDVWHGGDPAFSIPWLSGVCDPGESTDVNPWTDWRKTFTAAGVTAALDRYTGDIGRVRRFRDADRGSSGRIITIEVVGGAGVATVTGSQLRTALALPDTRVWINADRTITGPIRERYDQLMCEPGLATSATARVPGGAQQFFQDGGLYRNDDRSIVVWLRGAIDAEYRQVDAGRGVLGVPIGGAEGFGKALRCTGCKRAGFETGTIFLKPGVGAHALWGPVLHAYLDRNGPGGRLGFPETRVRRQPDGDRWARFEHGTIVCRPSGTCRVS